MTTTMKKSPVKKVSAPKTKKIVAQVAAPPIEATPAISEQVIPAVVIEKKRAAKAKKSTVMKEATLPASALAGDPYPLAEEAAVVVETPPVPEAPAWIVDLHIDQVPLVSALNALKPMISSRTTLPILANVKIVASLEQQTVEIHATNLETYGIVTIPTLVIQGGMFTASYNELLDIVKPFKGASIHLSVPEDVLTISCRGMEVTLPTMDVETYPLAAAFVNAAAAAASTEKTRIQETVTLPVTTFKQMVSMVEPAAADDQSRPVFCGVHFRLEHDVLILETVDAFRMHMMREKIEGAGTWDWTWLIDAKSLRTTIAKLPKAGTVTLTTTGLLVTEPTEKGPVTLPNWNSMILTTGNMQIAYRLIEATFPRVEGVIPKDNDLSALVDGNSFRQALDAVKGIVKDASNITRLEVKEGKISIVAAREGMAQPMTVAVEGTSEGEGKGMYNWVYLNAVARVAPPASMLHLRFTASNRPLLIKLSEVPGFLGVIMPMHMNK